MTAKVRLPLIEGAGDAPSSLPALQGRWLREMLDGAELPREENATCDDCAMLPPPGVTPKGGHWFNPLTRCCTYVPELANFLVGAALSDEGLTEGAASLRARRVGGANVSPLGLMQGAEFLSRYDASPEIFGRDHSLLCPHYEEGQCLVWPYRESTCATWFCKHTRGAVSKAFWNRFQQLMRAVERNLARHCAVELGVPPEGLALLLPMYTAQGGRPLHDVTPVVDALDASAYERLWGPWAGREEQFFIACARLVEPMRWSDVLNASGSEVRALAPIVRLALSRTSEEVTPSRVALGTMQVVGMTPEAVRVQGYSFLDPLDVPRALFDVLHCFDGRALDEAISAASEAAGEPVPVGAVRMLIDFGVLRAV